MEIPDGVTIKVDGASVEASGKFGKVKKLLNMPKTSIKLEGNKITVDGPIMYANTVKGHIKNMIKGASEGHVKNLKVVYAHFPISLEMKGKEIVIKNFVGEKQPRKAKIVGDTKVEIKGQNIKVSGPCKEDVGQTVANICSATKIKRLDPRIFQDGIYVIEG